MPLNQGDNHMSIRQVLLVASTAVISSFVTYHFTSDGTSGVLTNVDNGHHATSATHTSINDCNEPIVTASAGPAKLTTISAVEQSSPETEKNNTASPFESSQLSAADERIQRESVAAFSDFVATHRYNGSGQSDIAAAVEQRFQNEQVNYQWASSTENNILELFENESDLNTLTPLNVTCKSVNCQIILPVTDQSEVNSLSDSFLKIATVSELGMENPSVSFIADESAGRLVFYVSENGNTALFQ